MKTIGFILLFAVAGVLSAQVVLTRANRDALLVSTSTNTVSVSNVFRVVSALRPGMAMTNVDSYLNGLGMTNLTRPPREEEMAFQTTWGFTYFFPGTDTRLYLTSGSRQVGPDLYDWTDQVLESVRISRLGVDTFWVTFTNCPNEEAASELPLNAAVRNASETPNRKPASEAPAGGVGR